MEVSLVFAQEEESRVTTQLSISFQPRSGLYHLPSSLLSVPAEVPCSFSVYLPFGGCCHCCVTPAASLTHKEELRRRGGVVNVWRQGISRKQPAPLCIAPANKWMRLPLSLSLGPSCCCGIQEVGLGDRSFIVT